MASVRVAATVRIAARGLSPVMRRVLWAIRAIAGVAEAGSAKPQAAEITAGGAAWAEVLARMPAVRAAVVVGRLRAVKWSRSRRTAAGEALLGGVFGDGEGGGDVADGFVFEIAEEEGVAVAGGEGVDGGVEVGSEVVPGGRVGRVGGGCGGGHGGGGLAFVAAAAGLGADGVGGGVAGGVVEPTGEEDGRLEAGGALGEEEEDGLGGVVGEVAVAAGLAEAGVVDEVGVAVDELGEGVVVVVAGVGGEELGVGHGGPWSRVAAVARLRVVGVACRMGGYLRAGGLVTGVGGE